MKKLINLSILALAITNTSYAEEKNSVTQQEDQLEEVVVVGDSIPEFSTIKKDPVEKTEIYAGKKVTSTDMETIPEVTQNNLRQFFSQTPGLLVSEVSNESFASINYRGLGDPHEAFNIQALQDGVPVAADQYGYPAKYYITPSDYISSIDFIRGGGALMFGSQPSGVLNFKTREPNKDEPFSLLTKQVFGSKNLYSTYNEVSGTDNLSEDSSLGYLGYFHRRESDGFRDANSDNRINSGALKLDWKTDSDTRLFFNQDIYDASFGEAGGLTLAASGEGISNYDEDRFQTSTPFDTLSIGRYITTVGIEEQLDKDSLLTGKVWGGYFTRNSKRQNLGTAIAFGGKPNATTNQIQLQEFKSVGADLRFRQDWNLTESDASEDKSSFATGLTYNGVDSPFTVEQGAGASAETGELRRFIDRRTDAIAAFAENRFNFGNLSITPGVRLENISQEVDERFNAAASSQVPTVPLKSATQEDFVPLTGIGADYKLGEETELYANFSQAFKPVTFGDVVPLGPTDGISSDIAEGKVNNYELGIRGTESDLLSWDASAFYITYTNQFGRVGNVFGNTGRGRYYGLDLASELNLIGLLDEISNAENKLGKKYGILSFYANASLLNARLTEGALYGKTPQYAPDYLIRSGFLYRPTENTKIGFLGNLVDTHYGDDANSTNFFIPSYKVFDLTAELEVIKDTLSLVGGINNIFDENYYSRIRGNGIDPANPRNYYAGLTYKY